MGGGLLSSALALTLTVTTILSGTTNVRAAEITDKEAIDFEVTGNYTVKSISDADVTALAKAFGYDMAATGVHVCSADAKGYIDWDNSAIASWQVYETEVFQPVLSRDTNGNLVVGKDENGNVQKAWSTYAFYPTETAGVITHQKELFFVPGYSGSDSLPGTSDSYYGNTYDKTNEELNQGQARAAFDGRAVTDTYVPVERCSYDFVLSENHFCLSKECDKHIQTINNHLGLTELTTWRTTGATEGAPKEPFDYYVSEQTQITDAYVIRVYYTTDDIPLNWTQRNNLYNLFMIGVDAEFEVMDVYGNSYGKAWAPYDFLQMSVGTENRDKRCTDIWILPEGVETVLTLEDFTDDGTTNTPNDTPSNDNSSNDGSNENNKPNDSINNTPSDSNTSNDDNTSITPNKTYEFDLSNAESQTVSKEDFAALLEANKDNDVVIKSNNGVTFTFARGTMTEVDGKESYDFSTSMNNTYNDSMPSYIQKNSFVSQINFNYSGKLPAMASIRFYVGTDYAGKTLYYSLMNEDNTFAEVKSYVVDAEGYLSVWQDHCSSYVVTTEEPKQQETTTPPADNKTDTNAGTTNNANNTNNTDNAVTSPKTNDMIKMLVPVAGMLLLAVGGVFVGMKKRKMM